MVRVVVHRPAPFAFAWGLEMRGEHPAVVRKIRIHRAVSTVYTSKSRKRPHETGYTEPGQPACVNCPSVWKTSPSALIAPPSRRSQTMSQCSADSLVLPLSG